MQAQARGPLTEQAYLDARAKSLKIARTDGIDALLSQHRLDALVALTAGPAGLVDLVLGGEMGNGGSSRLAAIAGYPSVTVPAYQLFGWPVGVSFFADAWSDARLLSLAADFEVHSKARRAPTFRPTVELAE